MLQALVIEDNPLDQRLTAKRLEAAGIEATAVRDVANSADLCNHDVAVLDLDLVATQGLRSIEVFRTVHPSMPMVVLTGHEDLDGAKAAIRMGADDYLVKHQTSNEALVRALVLSIERRTPGSTPSEGDLVQTIRESGAGVVVLFDHPFELVLQRCAEAGVPTDQVRFVDMTQRTDPPAATPAGVFVVGSPVQLERATIRIQQACDGLDEAPLVIDSTKLLRLYNGDSDADAFLRHLEQHAMSQGRSVAFLTA